MSLKNKMRKTAIKAMIKAGKTEEEANNLFNSLCKLSPAELKEMKGKLKE